MRFREVFLYEIGHRLRSASTWLYAGFLFLIAFWVVHVAATGTNPIYLNAPNEVAKTTALFCGLFGMLVTAGLFSDAALRDRSVGMDPLLFTTRLRPTEYLGGRFLATLAIHAMLLLAIPLGLALAAQMPYLPREAFGPTRLAAHIQPLLLFSLPNLVLVGAILFTIAARTRQAIPVYLGMIAIFIGYIVAANYWPSITNPVLSAVADPLGINALQGMTEYWTASEQNTRLIGFPSMLLWNRLIWVAIAAGVLAVLMRTFRFTEREGRARRGSSPSFASAAPHPDRLPGGERGMIDASASPHRALGRTVPQVDGVFARGTRLRQTLAIARESLAEVMSGRAFQVAFVAAIGLVLLWGWNVGETVFETVTWPVTHLVAGVVLTQRAILIPWLVIVIYAGELVWKGRETGAAEIADALPVRTSTAFIGRFLALVALIVMFQFAFLIGGVLLQVLHGYYVFELGLYAKILFGIKLVDYILLAALAMTLHVLVNHKYVAHVLVLLIIIFGRAAQYGIHHLLIYNSGPEWMYSEMNGFGPFVAPFIAFKLYWAGWALLFGVVTLLFWVRGPELGIRQRLVIARSRFTRGTARMAVVAAVLILAVGGFIFYNTNILNEHLPPQKAGAPLAEYEKRYGRYRDLPQPVVTRADLRLEIYPDEAAVDMTGTYRLVNETGAPIRDVHVETPRGREYEVRSLTFEGGAKAELVDQEHGYRIFALAKPLPPGEALQFKFDVAFRPRGFPHGGWKTKVVGNGTYFDRMLMPFIGYQPFEVADVKERRKYGLPPQSPMPAPGDAEARRRYTGLRNGDGIHVETIVGTNADQIAIVPGMLRRSWTENGRRYFHYATRRPEIFGTAVFSAKYAVEKGAWAHSTRSGQARSTRSAQVPQSGAQRVALEIFHHPPHRANLDRMMAGAKASLDYYTAEFGPFPYRELRIMEIPPYSINARAFPSGVAFAEQNFLTRTGSGLVDLMFFGTAHEVAHHWWGGRVRPAYAKGRAFVSESLANYSAMMVTEKVLGPAEARRVYDFQMDRYLVRRAETGRDVPLLEVEDHPHISYGKGAVALYTLREHIGAERVNTALRRFLAEYGQSGPPYPTSLDLYAELRAVTPPSLHSLLTDLFETITLWDVKTERAATRRLPDGRYEVALDVVAQKLRADGTGVETPAPMNDFIEVGVFAAGKETPIYLTRHRIRSGPQTIRIIVPREPSRAGVDPYRKLIERERGNNVMEVEAGD